jgi:hypothetical protein
MAQARTRAGESAITSDHQAVKKWIEDRDGKPAAVKGTGTDNDPGILRVAFPGFSEKESLKEITWDEFFRKFDDAKLAFLYQEKTASGERSNFNKFVKREGKETKK